MKKKAKVSKGPSEAGNGTGEGLVMQVDWESPAGRLVGLRIQHFWDGEETWFSGRILKFNPANGQHLVRYDADGEEIWLEVEAEPILYCSQASVRSILPCVAPQHHASRSYHSGLRRLK